MSIQMHVLRKENVSYLDVDGVQGIFDLPFPGRAFSQAKIPASLKECIHINLTSDTLGVPNAIKYAPFDQPDISCTSEQGNHDDCVDRMSTCPAGNGLQAAGDLAL